VGLLAGEDDLAGVVVHALQQDLDLVAGLRGRLARVPLVEGDEALGLVADVDDDLVADDLDDLAGDDAAGLDARAVAEEEVHVELLGVRVGDVEFAEQDAIYHNKSVGSLNWVCPAPSRFGGTPRRSGSVVGPEARLRGGGPPPARGGRETSWISYPKRGVGRQSGLARSSSIYVPRPPIPSGKRPDGLR
jgi:hypothetical protein